jgi:hypothetical protein
MITGTYDLTVNPQWINLQLAEVFLECDTTFAPVTINLFEIADLKRFWNSKIIISDVNNYAGTNNITVNCGGSDVFDNDTINQLVLNVNGSSLSLQVVSESQWLAIESVGGVIAPVWDVIAGDPLLGADTSVESGVTQISETVNIGGDSFAVYKLRGTIQFDGSSNVYANYIGLVTVDLGQKFGVLANDSVLTCGDSGITGEVVSPLAVGGFVQNTLSGASENIAFALLNPDNTIGTSNEYYLFFLAGNANDFEATALLDITFITTSANITYTQNA